MIIGRFQPFHKGHLYAVEYALRNSDILNIGIGSANKSHEERNPFTAEERKEMILSSLSRDLVQKAKIHFIPDVGDDRQWFDGVRLIVAGYNVVFSNDPLTVKIHKERGVMAVEVPLQHRAMVSGTNVRRMMVEGEAWDSILPDGTIRVLERIDGVGRLKGMMRK